MWQYMWGHAVFHLLRWFPRNNRFKISVVVMLLTACLLVPQVWVMVQKHSTRWCSQPLYPMLILSIILTFVLMGFVFLFMAMVPVPRVVKVAFHIFGLFNFITGIVLSAFTLKAEHCKSSTEELYGISWGFTVISLMAIVEFEEDSTSSCYSSPPLTPQPWQFLCSQENEAGQDKTAQREK